MEMKTATYIENRLIHSERERERELKFSGSVKMVEEVNDVGSKYKHSDMAFQKVDHFQLVSNVELGGTMLHFDLLHAYVINGVATCHRKCDGIALVLLDLSCASSLASSF